MQCSQLDYLYLQHSIELSWKHVSKFLTHALTVHLDEPLKEGWEISPTFAEDHNFVNPCCTQNVLIFNGKKIL